MSTLTAEAHLAAEHWLEEGLSIENNVCPDQEEEYGLFEDHMKNI
jgi:hypothetical protein